MKASADLPSTSGEARAGAAPGRLLRLVTKCASVEEFVRAFQTFVDEHSIVVPDPKKELAPGNVCRFEISLKSGQIVMRGRCEAVERSNGQGRGNGQGKDASDPGKAVRARILELDDESRALHRRLVDARAERKRAQEAATPAPVVLPTDTTPGPSTTAPAPGASSGKPLWTGRTALFIAPRTPNDGSAKAEPNPPDQASKLSAEPAAPKPASVVPLPLHGTAPRSPLRVGAPPAQGALGPRKESPAPSTKPEPTKPARVAPPASSRNAPGGERTPGAPDKLPANPFSELSPENLQAFVECTLFEDFEGGRPKPDPSEAPVAKDADPHERATLPRAVVEADPAALRPTAPLPVVTAPANDSAITPPPVSVERPTVPAPTPALDPGNPDGADATSWLVLAATLKRVAPFVACSLASALIGYAIARPSASEVAKRQELPAPPAAAAPVAPPAPPAPAPAVAPAPAAEPPAAQPEREKTKLTIKTEPSGAFLRLDDYKLGRSPRTIDVNRGEEITLGAKRSGYQSTEKRVTLDEAEMTVVLRLAPSKGRASKGPSSTSPPPLGLASKTTPPPLGAAAKTTPPPLGTPTKPKR